MARKGSWLATYVEQYATTPKAEQEEVFIVAYRLRAKPRMFYYRLEQLLTVVGGRRIQKSVLLVPERGLSLVKELCRSYGAEVFAAPFGPKMKSE